MSFSASKMMHNSIRPTFRPTSGSPCRSTRCLSQGSTRFPPYLKPARPLAGPLSGICAVASFATWQFFNANPKQYERLDPPSVPGDQTQNSKSDSSSSGTSRWPSISDAISSAIMPAWAEKLPAFITKFQRDMDLAPGTLANEIWEDAHDPQIHPEVTRDASVRVSNDLCAEEKAFRQKRKQFTRKGLAKYLGLNEDEIHPDDVPIIAMCGSGGGLRACVAGASSYYAAQKAGLFDCVTYTGGVSGSCWLQTLYHSHIAEQRFDKLLEHLKARIGTHIAFPPDALKLMTEKPTNKYLLAGALEKYHGLPDADFGLVDLYGLLLAARLMVPKNGLDLDPGDLKVSHQRRYVDGGAHPLPIYTAVRHEIPKEGQDDGLGVQQLAAREKARKEAWFQWFEFTPYELFCEELGAGIPAWATGRAFRNGHTAWRESGTVLPEIRNTMLMGIWGSAFCATLSHYYKEVRPLVKGIYAFGGLDEMIHSRNDDLVKVHPIDPAQIPNYVLGMKGQLPQTCPESLHHTEQIELMDAGMSNNLPIYPLLRPGRDVDIIIAFDASQDIQKDNWLKVTDGYARQRGIRGWPIGTGWPNEEDAPVSKAGEAMGEAEGLSAKETAQKVDRAKGRQNEDHSTKAQEPTIGQGTVWVGSTQERMSDEEPPLSKQVQDDWELMKPDAGITVVYFPFLANPKVKGVDPQTSDFMSTWNFIYTPENIDSVTALAEANFADGQEKTKMAVRAVYERKRRQRLQREADGNSRQNGKWKLPA